MADVTTPFGFPYPESTDLVRDGATDIEALAQAANDQFSAGFQFAGQRIYTSSGTFAKANPLLTGDIGLRAIRVTVVGGGGGGGGIAASSTGGTGQLAQGGAGGNTAISFLTDMGALSATETVTRGGGGNGGASGANAGGDGGTSNFGSLVVASGGRGGQAGIGVATGLNLSGRRSETVAFTGQVVFRGGASTPAIMTNAGAPSGSLSSGGGSSFFAGAGLSQTTSGSLNGTAGVAHGGGGGGAQGLNFQSARAGGAGANGIVIVEVFV